MNTMTRTNPTPSEMQSGSQTILVVDDDPILRAVLSRGLREEGYQVLDAGQGEDALRICQHYAGPIHLLVADVVLPRKGGLVLTGRTVTASELNGIELARRVMALRPQTRVIFISGHTSDAIKHYGVMPPEMVFLQKPFAPDALARKVREVLEAPGQG